MLATAQYRPGLFSSLLRISICRVKSIEMPKSIRILRIALPRSSNDALPAQPHLVQAEVVEVTTVGKVDVAAVRVRHAEQLGEQRPQRLVRTVASIGLLAVLVGVAEPGAEPRIEQRHQ